MSELEIIQASLKRTAQRRRLLAAWQGLWLGLLVGAGVWLLALGIYKLLPVPPAFLGWAGLVASGTVLGVALWRGWRRYNLLQTARWVDAQQHFQERLSTALEVAGDERAGRWRELVMEDAARSARAFDVQRAMPWTLPRRARLCLLVLAVAAGVGFIPEYRTKEHRQRQNDAVVIKETGRRLEELVRRQLEVRPPALETQKVLEEVRELGQQMAKVQLSRQQALRDLASITDKVKEQVRELGKTPALRKLDPNERSSPLGGANTAEAMQQKLEALQEALNKQGGANPDALQKLQQDLRNLQAAAQAMAESSAGETAQQQLSQSLSDLAQRAEQMGLDLPQIEEAIKALADGKVSQMAKDLDLAGLDLEKLMQMAKAMKNLEQQLAEMGRTLGDQLDKGQGLAAYSTLNKMIKQLEAANLPSDQLQKLIQEVAEAVKPADGYGEVAKFLAQASKQLQAGEKSQGSRSLAQAAEELKKLMEQAADCDSLLASLAALKGAQMCVGNGNCWGMGLAKGCRPGSRPGGKPGRGVGTWADEGLMMDPEKDDFWDNTGMERPDRDPRGLTDRGPGQLSDALTPTQVKGQISPGGPMPSITLRGVSIRGQSKVEFEERVTSAQSDAQSALSQDQVPRAYRGAVRDYFDDLK